MGIKVRSECNREDLIKQTLTEKIQELFQLSVVKKFCFLIALLLTSCGGGEYTMEVEVTKLVSKPTIVRETVIVPSEVIVVTREVTPEVTKLITIEVTRPIPVEITKLVRVEVTKVHINPDAKTESSTTNNAILVVAAVIGAVATVISALVTVKVKLDVNSNQ